MDQDLIKAKLCSDFDESSLLNGLKHKKTRDLNRR